MALVKLAIAPLGGILECLVVIWGFCGGIFFLGVFEDGFWGLRHYGCIWAIFKGYLAGHFAGILAKIASYLAGII